MNKVKVVDARMGRGKTSAAAAYMSSCHGSKRFLYITPYLDEVDRICVRCDFEQPDNDECAKIINLKKMLRDGLNIAATHSLFYLLDDDAVDTIKKMKYCIIIDESIDVIHKISITPKDMNVLLEKFVSVDEESGVLTWSDEDYDGKFIAYKQMLQSGNVYKKDSALIYMMNPETLLAFEEVVMMTYMFNGQYQKGYLDYYGIEYQTCGVDIDDSDRNNIQFSFTDQPDAPPPVNFKDLIEIVEDEKMNTVGKDFYALSKKWFDDRDKNNKDIKALRAHLANFVRRKCNAKAKDVIWTTFKSSRDKIVSDGGRFGSSFVQLTARATNAYKDRTVVAYIANRFADPNMVKFFSEKGIKIDMNMFALSEMLQFIWRSAIRDGKRITVYIPSKRMRDLLKKWIEDTCENGGMKND